MNPTLATIVAQAQALTAAIVAYAATVVPVTGPVPANIAAALLVVTTTSNQLNADLVTPAGAFVLGSPSPAVIVTDVANLLAAVTALSAAVATPSNP